MHRLFSLITKKGGLQFKTCRAIVNIFDEYFGSWT